MGNLIILRFGKGSRDLTGKGKEKKAMPDAEKGAKDPLLHGELLRESQAQGEQTCKGAENKAEPTCSYLPSIRKKRG